MNIQSITHTSVQNATKAAKKLVQKYGPECPVELPRMTFSIRQGLDKYGNLITSHEDGWVVRHMPSGSKEYRSLDTRVVTNPSGEIRLWENSCSRTVYGNNGVQVGIEKSRITGKPVSAMVYTKKHPDGLLIESLTEDKTIGKLCSVRDKGMEYYGVTPDGKVKLYDRKSKADDIEFMKKAMNSQYKYELASIPAELVRAAYLAKI